MAGPPVPGDDPVVEGEPERREVLVRRRDGRQPLEHAAQVVAEEADQPAEERRRIGRDDEGAVEAGDEAARDRERVRAGGRRLEDRDRIGCQVGPAGVASRPGALEQDEAGQVAKRLGGVDRARRGDAVRKPPEPERRAGSIGRDHLPPDDTATRRRGSSSARLAPTVRARSPRRGRPRGQRNSSATYYGAELLFGARSPLARRPGRRTAAPAPLASTDADA